MAEVERRVLLLLLMLVERASTVAVRLEDAFLQSLGVMASGEGLGGSERQRDAHISLIQSRGGAPKMIGVKPKGLRVLLKVVEHSTFVNGMVIALCEACSEILPWVELWVMITVPRLFYVMNGDASLLARNRFVVLIHHLIQHSDRYRHLLLIIYLSKVRPHCRVLNSYVCSLRSFSFRKLFDTLREEGLKNPTVLIIQDLDHKYAFLGRPSLLR